MISGGLEPELSAVIDVLFPIEAVADSMYAEFKEPLYAPPPLLSRMVEAGLLGRKCWRGFFNYAK